MIISLHLFQQYARIIWHVEAGAIIIKMRCKLRFSAQNDEWVRVTLSLMVDAVSRLPNSSLSIVVVVVGFPTQLFMNSMKILPV